MPRRKAVVGDGPATPVKPEAPVAPAPVQPASTVDMVEALELGYHGDQLRKAGSRFQVPTGAKSEWFKKVG